MNETIEETEETENTSENVVENTEVIEDTNEEVIEDTTTEETSETTVVYTDFDYDFIMTEFDIIHQDLGVIVSFLVVFVLIILLRYIYKFFNMFF